MRSSHTDSPTLLNLPSILTFMLGVIAWLVKPKLPRRLTAVYAYVHPVCFTSPQAMVIYDVDGDMDDSLSVTLACGAGEFIMGEVSGLLFDPHGDDAMIASQDEDGSEEPSLPTPSNVLSFNGTAAAINRAMRDLRYRGLPGRVGQDTIRVTVTDDPGPCPGDFNVSALVNNATSSAESNATTGTAGGQAQCALGGAQTTQSEIQVFLSAVNRPPSVTVPQGETATTVDAEQAVAIATLSVDDPDVRETAYYSAGGLRIEGPVNVAVVCASGHLSLGARGGLSFSEGQGVSDPVLRFSGAIDDVNRALATLSYRCSSFYDCGPGKHDIVVSVDDNGFTGKGGALSANATFGVRVDDAME